MRPLTFLRVNTLLDFKAHSLKEHLDHIFNGPIDSPLMLGQDSPRTHRGNTGFTQDIKTHEGTFIKARSVVHPSLREFHILGNRMYYHLSTFKEIISFKNVYAKIKINKKGETRMDSKEYRFEDRSIEINYSENTFKSICYGSHTYTQRIRKNGLREHSILFPYTGCELYEYYNSKGVCTTSLFHFPYESGNGSIQLNLINGVVEFFCKGEPQSGYMLKNIKLPELKDASIVNLYNEYNCFFIDLMIPDSGLYESYQYGLAQLRTLVEERAEAAPYNKDVFRNMLTQIDMNTIKYET